jgi:hypothetical protein
LWMLLGHGKCFNVLVAAIEQFFSICSKLWGKTIYPFGGVLLQLFAKG